MNSMKPKEDVAMKDEKKVEITLEEAEQVTGGAGPSQSVFMCPKCNTRFRSFSELEVHCRAEHNINPWGQVGKQG